MSLWTILTLVNYAVVIASAAAVLQRRKEPAAMTAWLLTIFLVPFIGVALFWLIGENRIRRQARRRRRRRRAIEPALSRQAGALRPLHAHRETGRLPHRLRDLVRIAAAIGDHPPVHGNDVEVYHDAERIFLALSLAIEAARHSIHLEYYIFQPDDTGRAVRDLLAARARQGVHCRLLLDAVGSWNTNGAFLEPLRAAGVEVAFFLPVRLNARLLHLNCRNHRKLVVIDGATCFTGSQNIGDEYLGRMKKFGPWRDTHLRIDGPVASQLQEVFVEDWHFATGRDLSCDDALFPPLEPAGRSIVQMVASGPDRHAGAMHMLLLAAVSASRRSIRINTPYFIPDEAMMLSLRAAALRGVRVQLLLPSKSDSWFVLWAGRSYYEELLSAGVDISEYGLGMLHAKSVVIDERWAMVGSANMDVRSFKLNFEMTAILYDEGLARGLAADFDALLRAATRIERDAPSKWGLHRTLAAGLTRLAAPLL